MFSRRYKTGKACGLSHQEGRKVVWDIATDPANQVSVSTWLHPLWSLRIECRRLSIRNTFTPMARDFLQRDATARVRLSVTALKNFCCVKHFVCFITFAALKILTKQKSRASCLFLTVTHLEC